MDRIPFARAPCPGWPTSNRPTDAGILFLTWKKTDPRDKTQGDVGSDAFVKERGPNFRKRERETYKHVIRSFPIRGPLGGLVRSFAVDLSLSLRGAMETDK